MYSMILLNRFPSLLQTLLSLSAASCYSSKCWFRPLQLWAMHSFFPFPVKYHLKYGKYPPDFQDRHVSEKMLTSTGLSSILMWATKPWVCNTECGIQRSFMPSVSFGGWNGFQQIEGTTAKLGLCSSQVPATLPSWAFTAVSQLSLD